MTSDLDTRFMSLALTLGRRGLGNAWPNPAVGAVVVTDGMVVGRGWTQPGGRPHAEVEALRRAGTAARRAALHPARPRVARRGARRSTRRSSLARITASRRLASTRSWRQASHGSSRLWKTPIRELQGRG